MPAGALYARYVPPKPANKPAKPESVAEIPIKPFVDSHPDSPSHKRKRDDKSGKKAKRQESDLESAEKRSNATESTVTAESGNATSEVVAFDGEGRPSSAALITTAGDSQPLKPAKRIKRQRTSVAIGDGAGETADAAEDDGSAKRHAGVFAKFQKSLNASGEPAEQDDDMEMLDVAEQPILHGEKDSLASH